MPTSAMLRIQGGRPPSTNPVPCSTLEASIAPNIQLAGNFISRSTSATAERGADQRRQARRRGDLRGQTPAALEAATPVIASSSGSAAVRMMTRMRLHHGDSGDVGALLGGEHVICDSAPGLPASSAEVGSQP